MKSAFELAMERLGGSPLREYTAEQKEQLAEIDRKYDAQVAQVRLRPPAPEGEADAQAHLVAELATIEERRQREKDELRQRFAME